MQLVVILVQSIMIKGTVIAGTYFLLAPPTMEWLTASCWLRRRTNLSRDTWIT